MVRWIRLYSGITLGGLLLFALIAWCSSSVAVAAPPLAPLSQEVITTTFGFDTGLDGWELVSVHPEYPDASFEWRSSESCWVDHYRGTVCTSNFGLPPYQGVIIDTHTWADRIAPVPYWPVDIYYPRFVQPEALELIWHRPTGNYWTPWNRVFVRYSEEDPWQTLFLDDWPPTYSVTWPDRDYVEPAYRYHRLRLCLTETFGDCPYYYPGMDGNFHRPITAPVQIRIVVYQHEMPEVFIDEISFVNCQGCRGGWGDCETVDDPDFESYSYWDLGGSAVISPVDSVALLSTGDYVYQPFLVQAPRYTATVIARHVSTATSDSLVVNLSSNTGILLGSTGPVTVTADGLFHEVEAVIEDMTYTGDGLLTVASDQGDYEVDWICLYPGYGRNKCDTEERPFDFEEGYNVGDPNFNPSSYGFSQGWRGIEYPINDLYTGRTVWQRRIFGVTLDGHFENTAPFAMRAGATIQYLYPVVPEVITVTSTMDGWGTEKVQILTSSDAAHWSVAEEKEYDGAATDIITFTLNYASPVYVAVASLFDANIPSPLNMALINRVDMLACYGGPNQFADCLVGDPDFDIADGYPSTFYWRGSYNAAAGAATMQQGGSVYQDFTPPWAGLWNVAVTGSSTSSPCTWDVSVTNYGSPVEIAAKQVQCQGSQQTTNVVFNLPATPVTLWIEQVAGNSSISRVCITPTGGPGQCLNANPDLLGATGYTGDWYDAGGRVTIPADGKLAAVGVEYQRAPPPYELELIVSPAVTATSADLTINHGNVPGLDPTADVTHTITQTTGLTYALASDISGGFGPTLWNQGAGDLSILRYCLTPETITDTVDPFWCATVTNPDFIDGLTGWDSSNVMAFNGIASFATDAYVSQGLGSLVTETTNATVRWLADGYASTVATLTVASNSGVFSSSHSISPGNARFYEDLGTISGTTAITVSAVNSGLELDFICLYPGDTAPLLPPVDPDDPEQGVEIPPGGELAECIAPPMGILPTITETLQSLWPWGGTMTHYEVLMAYNTGWVRFIGCRLDYFVTWMEDVFWGEPWRLGLGGNGLRAKLDQIIFLLAALNILAAIQALLALLQTIGLAVDSILDNLLDIGRIILYVIGIVGLALLALLGLLILLMAIITLIWQIPQEFWTSFRGAVTGSDAVALPLPDSAEDPLYNIIVGIQVVNQVAGQTILFPIVVLAVTLGSFAVLIWTIKQFGIKVG